MAVIAVAHSAGGHRLLPDRESLSKQLRPDQSPPVSSDRTAGCRARPPIINQTIADAKLMQSGNTGTEDIFRGDEELSTPVNTTR